MAHSTIRIHKELLDLLKAHKLQNFTALELKNNFLNISPHITNTQASQLIHRTLNKLCNIGFMEKKTDNGRAKFTKTAIFDASKLSASTKSRLNKEELLIRDKTRRLQKLRTTLKQYQMDLLGYIGEADEFQRLFKELPEAKSPLYPSYMRAKNNSSATRGKIKAVEACINTFES